jgi:hypothetical protein
MKVHVSPDSVQERSADGRGRVNLGTEFADKRVEVAVLEVLDDE